MRTSHKAFKPRVGLRSTHGGSLDKTMSLDMAKNLTCALCLERIQDTAYLNPCNHRFCFKCIQEWSRKKVICPLCKQHFCSFFHRVSTKEAFCEYVLPLNDSSSYSESRRGLSSAFQRPTSPLDSGIVNNEIRRGLTQTEKDIYQLMRQFAVTKRSSKADVISLGKFKAQAVILFRRALYHAGIMVRNARKSVFNQYTSAEYFNRNPSCFGRLIPWLKRELKVLCGNQRPLIHTLQNFILNIMTQHDLQSKDFEALLRPHLRQFTSHFLHEFIHFVQSPYNMKKYDWAASYECPALTRQELDAFISSASSDDECSQPFHSNQTPNANSHSDDRSQESLCFTSDKAVMTKADSTNKSNNEEIDLKDLSSSDTEKETHSTDGFIKNKFFVLQQVKKPQPVGLLSDSRTLGCMEENEDAQELHPVQTQNSKTSEGYKNSSNVLGSGDDSTFSFNHRPTADIKTMINSIEEETTKRQPPDFTTSHLRSSSLEKSMISPSKKDALKKGRSRGMECNFEEEYIATTERPRERNRVRLPHEGGHCTDFSRASRLRKEQRNSRARDGNLLHKTTLPLRSESIATRDVNKLTSQNRHGFRKQRSKDYEYFQNRVSSEPNWRHLYYRQDCERYRYEVPLCSKGEPTRFYSSNPLASSRVKSHFLPENKIMINQASFSKSWYLCSASERYRSMGSSRGRFSALGQERGPYDKKRRHKLHHMESEDSRRGKRCFQDYAYS